MRISYQNDQFIVKSEYSEKDIIKSVGGFRWNGDSDKKYWWTNDENKVLKLKELKNRNPEVEIKVSQEAVAELKRRFGLKKEKLEKSTNLMIELPRPEGLDYLNFQKEDIIKMSDMKNVLLGNEMGTGKEQPIDAKILTPDGWKTMGDIEIGDLVIGSDGKSKKVLNIYLQGIKDIYKITFTDNSSTECGLKHLWYVQTGTQKSRNSKGNIITTGEILEFGVAYDNGKLKHYIPMINAVEYNKIDLPLDAYLLGFLLGDGSFRSGSPSFSKEDHELVDKVDKLIPVGMKLSSHGENDYRIISKLGKYKDSNILKKILANLGLWECYSGNKFIPKIYLQSSIEDRIKLLHGLMDTDGTVLNGCRTVSYSTSSSRLRDNIIELIQSLGGVARFSTNRNSKYTYKKEIRFGLDNYLLNINLPENVIPFDYSRKLNWWNKQPDKKYPPSRGIKKIEYVGKKEAKCIYIDSQDHLYVTDNFILTHNTIETIGIVNYTKPNRIIIVSPASLKFNWRNELKTWLVDYNDYEIIIINGEFRLPIKEKFIIIINYELIHKYYRTLMSFYHFDLLVADESHFLKNPKTNRTRLILGGRFKFDDQDKPEKISGISAICKQRLYLTGTPILNRPKEIFPLINNLSPQEFPNFFTFAKKYCGAVRDRYGWNFDGASNLDELRQRLYSTVMIRRLKKDVLSELKGKRRQIIELNRPSGIGTLLEEEKRLFDLYRAEKEHIRTILEANENEETLPEEYKEKVSNLRNSTKIAFSEMARIRKETAIAKIPQALTFIEDVLENEDKVVVFCHHHEVYDAVMDKFKDKATGFDGRVINTEQRMNRVEKFQTDPNIKIFVGGILAAGVGITLTAAAVAVFIELDWTPGKMNQAEDRLSRIGQSELVLIIHLVFEDSLDAKMAKTIIKKQEIIEQALDRDVNTELLSKTTLEMVEEDKEMVLDLPTDDTSQNKIAIDLSSFEKEKPEEPKEEIWDDSLSAQMVLMALQGLSGVCNYASTNDGTGFNKSDAHLGHELASKSRLTKKQVIVAKSMLRKYHRQINEGVYYLIFDMKEDIKNLEEENKNEC